MKKMKFSKGNIIAIAMAAVLAVGGVGAYKANAAERIDTSKAVSLTINLPEDIRKNSKADVEVNLYKIGTLEENGDFNSTTAAITSEKLSDITDAEGLKAAVDKFFEGNPTTADVKAKIEGNQSSVVIKDDALVQGIYAVSMKMGVPTADDIMEYEFTNFIIALPSNEYNTKLENGNVVNTDNWVYDVSAMVKAEPTPLYGRIKIVKTLKVNNITENVEGDILYDSSFVYEVTAVAPAEGGGTEVVFNNVYAINYNHSEEHSVVTDLIPCNATVTVKEIYTGSNYSAESEVEITGLTVKNLSAKDDNSNVINEPTKAEFINTFNNQKKTGGMAITNKFSSSDGTKYEGKSFISDLVQPY